jgi:astacin
LYQRACTRALVLARLYSQYFLALFLLKFLNQTAKTRIELWDMRLLRHTSVLFLACLIALSGALFAAPPEDSIRLTTPSTPAAETEASSIDLKGTVETQNAPSAVLWVNQFGQRESGVWAAAGPDTATGSGAVKAAWAVPDLPLRPGINLIAVTVVDVNNQAVSLHLAVNRKPEAGTRPRQPLEIRSGTWRNRPVVYQVWNGRRVVEGDIVLDSPEPGDSAAASQISGRSAGKPMPHEIGGSKPNGLGAGYLSQLWPNAGGVYQIPYIISGVSANLTTALNAFNQTFSGFIQFVPRSSQNNYVDIIVEGGSGEGFSQVGMAGNEQTLSCGSGCTVATWLHEMGHTAGLLHEHQRPDRASYITLTLANADLPSVPGNFTLFSYDYQAMGLYDYASIMHYSAFDFSKAGLPVLESIPPGIPLSNNNGYSAGDIDQVERLYGINPSEVTVTTNPPGLGIIVDGQGYTAPHAFNWTLNSTHTLSLPADPQVTNPADGSTYAFGNWNDLGKRTHVITVAPGTGTLTSPANEPAVTMYEANFVRLQPFAFLSPAVYPSGAGIVAVSPAPIAEYGGSFFADRTLVTLSLTPTPGSGYNFYDWFHLPFPPSDNPHAFYIQAPTTQAQAVFVPAPVTIVGESITGPHTANPGLSGLVDGNFAFLPAGFSSYYNGAAWNSGTTHSIGVSQQQSPVTTNVFYNWNSWTDGGAITHNIVQPSSGSQTITASFTPFYAYYTVPAPLGGANASCYGGVAASPAGTLYAQNTVFDFYQDGASVTTTASPNPVFPAMVFAGWTGSTGGLSGNTNPTITTIHDQFVPTANFDLSATPIAITSLNPSSAIAGSGAIDVTVNGTGFTANSTYASWNGNSRAITFVSSTQITMHLSAGDLTNEGVQDIFVVNSTTNSSNITCGTGAEISFTVTTPGATGPPIGVSVSPGSGTGLTQKFTMVYSDPHGVSDVKNVSVLFNTSKAPSSACDVLYSVSANRLYLYNDAGTTLSAGVAPGSAATVSNSQCTLTGTGSSFSTSGNDVTLKAALTFTNTFVGKKNVYLSAGGKTSSSGFAEKGTWTP